MLKSKAAVLVASGLCALAGLVLAQSYVSQAGRTVEVVVAGHDIAPFARIKPEDVKVVKYPAVAVRKDAFRRIEDVKDKMTRSVIPAGVPVSLPYLAGESSDQGGSLARTLREAGRPGAFSMQFPSVDAVAGRLAPGDRVDVLLGFKPVKQEEPTRVETVPGALVLDVLKPSEQQQAAGGGGTVTVVFSADEKLASKLLEARQAGAAVSLRLLPAQGAPGPAQAAAQEAPAKAAPAQAAVSQKAPAQGAAQGAPVQAAAQGAPVQAAAHER